MPMQLDYYSSVMLVKFDHKCHVHKLSSKPFGSLWLEKQLLCSFFWLCLLKGIFPENFVMGKKSLNNWTEY